MRYLHRNIHTALHCYRGLPGNSAVSNPPADVRDAVSISGSGRSPEEGHGSPLQYSCLENPIKRGSWWGYSPCGHQRVRHSLATREQHCYKRSSYNIMTWKDRDLSGTHPAAPGHSTSSLACAVGGLSLTEVSPFLSHSSVLQTPTFHLWGLSFSSPLPGLPQWLRW